MSDTETTRTGTEGLTEAEREQVALACDAMFDFGDTWIRFLRDGNETVLLPVMERILADRLAAVRAEAEKSREESRHAREAAAEYVTVALETRSRAESAEAERDALRERVEAVESLADEWARMARDNREAAMRHGDIERDWIASDYEVKGAALRAALDADR